MQSMIRLPIGGGQLEYEWFDLTLAWRINPLTVVFHHRIGTDPIILRQLAQLISGTDLTPQLPRLETPVLLSSGDGSPCVRVEQVAALQPLLPASQACIIPNARHGMAFSHAGPCV